MDILLILLRYLGEDMEEMVQMIQALMETFIFLKIIFSLPDPVLVEHGLNLWVPEKESIAEYDTMTTHLNITALKEG